MIAALAAGAGCRSAPVLELRYLPGFVPGSMNVFRPARIAVAPVGGELALGTARVGAIYAADGSVERELFVRDPGVAVAAAVVRALEDAGLKPVLLDSSTAFGGELPDGVDLLLRAELAGLTVDKRFAERDTVHGKYFTMESSVRLKFELANRGATKVLTFETAGTQHEPPAPVGKEEFLPLETEPAESLSVAMSKAVGAMIVDSELRDLLPVRDPTPPIPNTAPSEPR
jgi:hypothetical protein